MTRSYAQLSRGLFAAPYMRRLSMPARVVYAAILTAENGGALPAVVVRPEGYAADLMIGLDEVKSALAELDDSGEIVYGAESRVAFLPRVLREFPPTGEKVVASARKRFDELPFDDRTDVDLAQRIFTETLSALSGEKVTKDGKPKTRSDRDVFAENSPAWLTPGDGIPHRYPIEGVSTHKQQHAPDPQPKPSPKQQHEPVAARATPEQLAELLAAEIPSDVTRSSPNLARDLAADVANHVGSIAPLARVIREAGKRLDRVAKVKPVRNPTGLFRVAFRELLDPIALEAASAAGEGDDVASWMAEDIDDTLVALENERRVAAEKRAEAQALGRNGTPIFVQPPFLPKKTGT